MRSTNAHSTEDSTTDRDVEPGLALTVEPGALAICRLDPRSRVPAWALEGRFVALTRTPEELSLVCAQSAVPDQVRCQRGWRAIKVIGPLDLSLIGVLASVAEPLAAAGLGLFCISTYDTDYILVRGAKLEQACEVLRAAGHRFDAPREAPVVAVPPPTEVSDQPTAGGQPAEPAPVARHPGAESTAAAAADDDDDDDPAAEQPAAAAQDREPVEGSVEDPVEDSVEDPVTAPPRVLRSGRRRRRRRPAPDEAAAAPPAAADQPAADQEQAIAAVPERAAPERAAPERASPEPAAPEPAAPKRAAPKPAARRPAAADRSRDSDEDPTSDGLYTGAIQQHPVETTDQRFDGLGLSAPILATVERVGFTHPTPIQAAVVPVALAGKDVIGLAETGSGKTAAFVLPLAERLTHGRGIRGLILCPTREIALQTKAFLDIFGQYHALDTVCVIGGVRIGPQMDHLRRHPDIIVATPGRLVDHVGRGTVRLDKIEALVLDEADHMLDLGFLPQIQAILQELPEKRHTMMFSATMPPPIERLAQRFMDDPQQIDFRPDGRTARGIEHRVYLVRAADKMACFEALLEEVPGSTLVFTRRKIEAEAISRVLQNDGHRAERLHSDRSQGQRVEALRAFRDGKTRVLVATDVAARGLDIPRIEHVINYELPEIVEDYVHRAGRTARGTACGLVSSIATWKDKITIGEIERVIGQPLPRKTANGVEPYVELKPRPSIRRRLL